jgi:hypothetical protein
VSSACGVERLSALRVVFGHQSVGANIVDGVHHLMALQEREPWQLIDIAEVGRRTDGFLAHGRLGRNGDPASKTREFCTLMSGPVGAQVDIALHKYCYVDIDATTDVTGLFRFYRDAITNLKRTRPTLTVVHVTTPLVRVRTGLRARLRGAVGLPSLQIADNARREEFNDRLRALACPEEPLFDLAALESIDQTDRSLRADYTDDGGHLNGKGRRQIAEALVGFLGEES